MKRLVLIGFIASLFAVLSAQSLIAQNDDIEKWYFGVGLEGAQGSLSAFTLEGDHRVLIESGVERVQNSWRLGPQLAIGLLSIDGERSLYRFTRDEAVLLTPQFEITADVPLFHMVVAYRHPYAVAITSVYHLDDRHNLNDQYWLLNLDSNTFEILSGLGEDQLYEAPAFSEDGRYLRYFTWDPTMYDTWEEAPGTLWERDLETGEDKAIHQLLTVSPPAHRDRYGERWLQYTDSDSGIRTYTLYSADGSTEVVAEVAHDLEQPGTWYSLYDYYLAEIYSPCNSECPVSFTPLNGGETIHLTVPSMTRRGFYPLAWAGDDRLLAWLDGDLWFLDTDGSAEYFGSTSFDFLIADEITRDGRLVPALDNWDVPERFFVWDVHSRAVVVEEDLQEAIILKAFEGGFMFGDLGTDTIKFYRYREGSVIELPFPTWNNYLDFQFDGSALFYLPQAEPDFPEGFYRYDPDEGSFTFLVPLSPISIHQFYEWRNVLRPPS